MKHYINKFDCVTFDIFDTLITRCVNHPHDVFLLVEKYCKNNSVQIPDDFKKKRITAELTVNQKNARPSTLHEIYNFFCEEYCGNPERLVLIEKLIELNVCKPNYDVVKIFNDCINNGKKVYIISDMYLDSQFLEELLFKCGIKGFEKVFVSCEYGATKTNGELFERVIKEVNISPNEWLHIGDNPKGDIKAPKKLGINVKRIDRKDNYKYNQKAYIASNLDFVVTNRCIDILGESLNKIEAMGARILGPLLIGFSNWLTLELKKNDINKVLFLSRDGYTIKKAFEILNPDEYITEYIYASRRSWTVPAIWLEPEYHDVLKNISMSPKTSVNSFLQRLGLIPETCLNEVKICDLSLDTIIEKRCLNDSKQFRKLYDLVKERVIKNSKEEYKALCEYLIQNNIKGKLAIVDIGYNGTMQKALLKILDSMNVKSELYGFYMGMNSKSKLVENNEIVAKGFLYGPNQKNDYQNKINAFISVFESCFLAQHGSVYRFKYDEDKVVVEFYEYEYEALNGRYVDEISIIKEFQKGALKFVDFMSEIVNADLINIDNGISINNLLCMGLKPERIGVDLFADFRMFDTGILYIAHPKKINKYFLHPKKLVNDFKLSTWKIAFLYQLIHIPLPYEKIYYLLKKYFV